MNYGLSASVAAKVSIKYGYIIFHLIEKRSIYHSILLLNHISFMTLHQLKSHISGLSSKN